MVIALTVALPFILAAFVRKSRWPLSERTIGQLLAAMLLVNYLGYEIYLAATVGLEWKKVLPFQLCDWAMIAIVVALLTGRNRWLEVAYFWGIGGTLQAIDASLLAVPVDPAASGDGLPAHAAWITDVIPCNLWVIR